MYLCYMDESGVPEMPGNSSHFVLTGFALPAESWKTHYEELEKIKDNYFLRGKEIHTAWMLRPYREQQVIPNFENLSYEDRKIIVQENRDKELARLRNQGNRALYTQTEKNYRKTNDYIHLGLAERKKIIDDIASAVALWSDSRLFAECIDKTHFNPQWINKTAEEQCFEQVASRFEYFLQAMNNSCLRYGILAYDMKPSIAQKQTRLMNEYHQKGTPWINIKYIIETPFFVDSALTGMIQIADLCGYALRRYLERDEDHLFQKIFQRADRRNGIAVGVRHFTKPECDCQICLSHRKTI